jgi:hypothetical protein
MKGKDIPQQSMKSTGYEIAAALLEKEVKSGLVAENQRLKYILLRMYDCYDLGRKRRDLRHLILT